MAKRRKKRGAGSPLGFGMKEWLIIGGAGLVAFFIFRPKATAGTYSPPPPPTIPSGGSSTGSGNSTGSGSSSGGTLGTNYLGATTYSNMFMSRNTNYNAFATLALNSPYYYEVYILQDILKRNGNITLVKDGLFGPNTLSALQNTAGVSEIKLKDVFAVYGNPITGGFQ